MAGQLDDFLTTQHARLGREHILELAIVEARSAGGDDENHALASAHADRLGDLRRLHPMRRRRKINRRRALFGDENVNIGGVAGEVIADGFEAHETGLTQSCLRRNRAMRRIMLTRTVHYDE